MKTNLCRLSLLFALCATTTVVAAPLVETTAVHTRPDVGAPAITHLKAGTEPAAAATTANIPPGWMAVELPGPFEGYVENKDLAKNLDVKPGSLVRVAPKTDAGVLLVADKDDKITITGLRGRWTQLSIERNIVGYIRVRGTPPPPPPAQPAPAAPSAAPPISPAPVAPTAYGTAGAGQAAPVVGLSDASALPRQFAGRFVSTRRPFTPRRPYDFALNDDAGKRYAYLNISKLLQTEQIEKYIDHSVVVFGTAKAVPGTRDIVIDVESLRLK